MIIFGTRAKLLSAIGTQHTCNHCNTGKLNLVYTGRYFHIFWIPMFPLGKQGMTQCPHCKQTLTERELAPQSRSYLQSQKGTVKTPLTHFSGLILFGVLILSVILINAFDKTGGYIRNPEVGDVYQVKGFDENQFTLWKVAAVEGDSVVFNTSSLSNLSQTDITEETVFGKLDESFTSSTVKLAKRNIKSMTKNNKNLVEIFRK